MTRALLLLVAWVLVVGCGSSGDDGDPAPKTPEPAAPGTDAPEITAPDAVDEREGIDGDFKEVAVTITGPEGETCELCLLLADTPELRSQGLMRVTDPELGGYDGMLFDHGTAAVGGYWMMNTPMPLSIAYWGEDGGFVSSVDMEPCVDDPDGGCPTYPPGGPYRWALEVPRGGLEEILAVKGATISVDGPTCPAGGT